MALDTLGQSMEGTAPAVAAGSPAKGDYRCADCGYGIVALRELPVCPMCRSESWLPQGWRPFSSRPSADAEA